MACSAGWSASSGASRAAIARRQSASAAAGSGAGAGTAAAPYDGMAFAPCPVRTMHNHDRRPSTCATSRPHRAASRPARGQALIETAIGIVLLLLLTFSIVDAAMLFYTYLTLENGVTEATRFAVTGQQTSDPANPTTALSREDSIKRVMRSSTPGLEIPDREFRFDDISQPGTPGAGNPNDVIQI